MTRNHYIPCRVRVPSRRPVLVACLALLAHGACQSKSDGESSATSVRDRYEKLELRIPMRDGVELYTAVYRPRDRSHAYPFLLHRTPYRAGPYGPDAYREKLGPSPAMEQAGYIFVYQDVRGRFMSAGEYVNMRPHRATGVLGGVLGGALGKTDAADIAADIDESTDTYDTIEYLLESVTGHNGKVGMWGISYPGFYTAAGAIDSHPALFAVSPQAPIADWFWDDMHRHGAFNLALAFGFFSSFGKKRPGLIEDGPERFDFKTLDGYRFYLDMGPLSRANELYLKGEIDFWNQIVAHPNYDEFWQARNLLPHLRNVKCAVLTVGGFFDSEDLYGPPRIYRAIEDNNPGIASSLVLGPWSHGGWGRTEGDSLGDIDFGAKTSLFYQKYVELAFFEHHLKGAPAPDLPEALIFETGHNRWRGFASWPPADLQSRRIYLRDNGALSFTAPTSESPQPGSDANEDTNDEVGAQAGSEAVAQAVPAHLGEAHDAYLSDPHKPVPYTTEIIDRWSKKFMTADQRFASQRPDVLVYQTPPLDEDITLAGPSTVRLWVSTTGTDADFIVKIIDVYPGEIRDADHKLDPMGHYQMLVRAEAMRARFRNSYEHPEPLAKDRVTEVSFQLWDVLHTFKKGHRIMIQVQSTWFPWIDRNPQRYVDSIFAAREDDFVATTHRIYRSPEHPSSIQVGVLTRPYDPAQAPLRDKVSAESQIPAK